jgi:hypothetical protein
VAEKKKKKKKKKNQVKMLFEKSSLFLSSKQIPDESIAI